MLVLSLNASCSSIYYPSLSFIIHNYPALSDILCYPVSSTVYYLVLLCRTVCCRELLSCTLCYPTFSTIPHCLLSHTVCCPILSIIPHRLLPHPYHYPTLFVTQPFPLSHTVCYPTLSFITHCLLPHPFHYPTLSIVSLLSQAFDYPSIFFSFSMIL